jgi:hypothetical protein
MNALAPAGAFFFALRQYLFLHYLNTRLKGSVHFGTMLPDLGNNVAGWNYNYLIVKNLLVWHVIRPFLMHHPKPPGSWPLNPEPETPKPRIGNP